MTEIVKTTAFVLRARKYSETSKILTLYSEKFGKINAIAKGARKPKSKFAQCLDLFSLVSVVIYRKSTTHLHLISDCDLIKSYYKVAEDIEKYEVALKIFELIYKIMHDEEENIQLFNLLKKTMSNLESASRNVHNIYFYFLIKCGEILGYAYNFKKCSRCGYKFIDLETSEKKIVFDFSRGGPLCENCENIVLQPQILNLGMLKILDKFESADDSSKTLDLRLTTKEINELENFLFNYLRYHISDLKDLKSQKIFKRLRY